MSSDILYSACKDDLYFPCKNAQFFSGGQPKSEAALCVELARLAYCRRKSDFAFDQDRIRAVLSGVGFDACQFFESQGDPRHGGTHCFLAMRASAEPGSQLAVVAFRGTDKDDPTDLGDDVDVLRHSWKKGGKVHLGFANGLNAVQAKLAAALASIQCRVLFTGHSLGAAMATLLASLRKPDGLFTFGSPRVGDADFVATLADVKGGRYVDCCDIVARVPPQVLGYAHFGEPYYIDRDRQIPPNPSDAFMCEDRLLAEAEYIEKYAWKIGNVGVRDLADHAPVNYVTAVMAA